jgi:hypothetical protein
MVTPVSSRPGDVFTIQIGSTACATGMIMQARKTMPIIVENAGNLKIAQRYTVTGTKT